MGEMPVHHADDEREGQLDERGNRSDRHDPADHGDGRNERRRPEAHAAPAPHVKGHGPRGCDSLRDDRPERRAFQSHAEALNEQRVERDVRQGADDERRAREPRAPLGPDAVVQADADVREEHSPEDDVVVLPGVGKNGVARSDDAKDVVPPDGPRDYERDGLQDEQEHAVAERAFGALGPAFPERDGDERRRAHARKHRRRVDEDHERKNHRDSRDPEIPDRVSDEDPVNDIVERVCEHPHDRGDRETDKKRRDGLPSQAFGCFHRVFLLHGAFHAAVGAKSRVRNGPAGFAL